MTSLRFDIGEFGAVGDGRTENTGPVFDADFMPMPELNPAWADPAW